jgi:ABC-type uncharacterized transport system permease subunit
MTTKNVIFTIDNSVDPAEVRVAEAGREGTVKILLMKPLQSDKRMSLTVMDLVQVLNKLGHAVTYEELP